MTRDLNPRARLCTGESFAAKTLAISVNRIRFPIYIHNFELKWAPSSAKIFPLPLKAGAELILFYILDHAKVVVLTEVLKFPNAVHSVALKIVKDELCNLNEDQLRIHAVRLAQPSR